MESAPDVTEQVSAPPETEDHILLTLEAPLADGRVLTLEAVGKVLDEYSCGVREVQVYDGSTLLQTVSVRDAAEPERIDGMSTRTYTSCWSPEDSMEVLDLNFDGNADFGLFAWTPNNTIPYYYWQWDGEQYQFSCTLQGVEVHPEAGEISSAYRVSMDGVYYQRDYYRPDGDGNLYLARRELEYDVFPNLDYDRGCAVETWVPQEGVTIRPGPAEQDADTLVLIRREIPVREIGADHTFSRFTEIWELKDGQLQMTSREEHTGTDM